MFTRESLMESEWYQDRFQARREVDRSPLEARIKSLKIFLNKEHYAEKALHLELREKLAKTTRQLEELRKHPKKALSKLAGTIGTNPSLL